MLRLTSVIILNVNFSLSQAFLHLWNLVGISWKLFALCGEDGKHIIIPTTWACDKKAEVKDLFSVWRVLFSC